MASSLPSVEFIRIYDSLPGEARQAFVEKHLAKLLDGIPSDQCCKVISAVSRYKTRYESIPDLDLKAKQMEIKALLDAFAKDSKHSILRERSNRKELVAEIADSLVGWLSDIWSVVYEYSVNFALAHACLLYAVQSIQELTVAGFGGCECNILNISVNVTIKNKRRFVIKNFHLIGLQNIDRALLWIWRELFVSLIARGSESVKKKIPDMLEDIENAMGWRTLIRILHGGKRMDNEFICSECPEADGGWTDEAYIPDSEDGDAVEKEDDDQIDMSEDEARSDGSGATDESLYCSCGLHGQHWSPPINRARHKLRTAVQERLRGIFETTPSLPLYDAIVEISPYDDDMDEWLDATLSRIASSTPETLVAALVIYTSHENYAELHALLKSHAYLLRSRDAGAFQNAISILARSEYRSFCIGILEKELLDCVLAIQSATLTTFRHLQDKVHKDKLEEILKMPVSDTGRRMRITEWVEAIFTPSNELHPLSFAAMLMGFPVGPGMDGELDEDTDIMEFLDMNESDSEFEDLREEFRPDLTGRFQGWRNVSQGIKGGNAVLVKTFKKAVELMPFLRSQEVVEVMLECISIWPSKRYLCEALEALSLYCRFQAKKLRRAAEKKANANKGNANTTNASLSASSSQAPDPTPTQDDVDYPLFFPHVAVAHD